MVKNKNSRTDSGDADPGGTGVDLEPDISSRGLPGALPVESVAEIEDSDPVAEAWSIPGEDFRVELFRIKPTNWRGQDITGYCDDLAVEDSFASIKSRFGGGMYRIVRRDLKSGKLQWARVFKIAGAPVLSSSATEADPQTPGLVPVEKPSNPVGAMDLGGVSIPLTGDIQELQRMIVFVKAIKSVFPDPPDYNQALLTALLERRQEDPLELLAKLRGAVPEIFGGGSDGGGESNLYSLLQEAIKQAGGILGGLAAVRRPVAARPMSSRPAIPASSTHSETLRPEPVTLAAPETEVEPVARNSQQVAMTAVAEIVKAFIMEPSQSAADVVGGLDLATGIQAADRGALVPFKGALRSMAERNLPEYIEEVSPETLVRFRDYFDSVFDSFVDPGRVGL